MKRSSLTLISLVPLVMVAFSLVTMICLFQIDRMVHGTLYSYGLEFSLDWAQPYWRMTTLVFAMGWLNIIAALGFHVYVVTSETMQARRFAEAVRDEVMMTRLRPVAVARGARQQVRPTPAQPRTKEAIRPTPTQTPTQRTTSEKTPSPQTVKEGDASKEAPAPTATDQQPKQSEQPKEDAPQQKEPEQQSQPQQNETKPETTEKKEETPLVVGVPAE